METVARNLRFLLWSNRVPKEEWVSVLAGVIGGDHARAERVLLGEDATLQKEEEKGVRKRFGGGEPISTADLVEASGTDVLAENLRGMIDSLPYGEKKTMASDLGVDVTTISRWRGGSVRPSKRKQAMISDYFGIPTGIDLEASPLFLSMEPVTDSECRAWVHRKIDSIDKASLREIMPALRRLFPGNDPR